MSVEFSEQDFRRTIFEGSFAVYGPLHYAMMLLAGGKWLSVAVNALVCGKIAEFFWRNPTLNW